MDDIDFHPTPSNRKVNVSEETNDFGFEPTPKKSSLRETLFGQKPKNLFQFPTKGEKKFRQDLQNTLVEGTPGFGQGYINSLIGLGNMIPGINIPKLNLAPQTEAGKAGEMAGDIGSYGGPRAIFGLTRAPHLISNALKESPISAAIMRNLGSGTEAALFGASHAPEGQKAEEAGKMGLIGSGMHLANSLLSHQMPLLARLGAAGVGAGIGSIVGHPAAGAILGGLLPQLKGAVIGPSKLTLAENALRDVNPQKISKSLAANKPLKTIPTPGQAEGSYVVQAREGALRKQAGKLGEDLEREALEKQSKAGKKMLNQVYKPTKANEKAITQAYKKAETQRLPMPEVEAMKADPIINEAFESVRRQSSFKDIPENSYKFLMQVHRNLWDRRIALAKSSSGQDRIHANEINNARLAFNKYLKSKNTDYKEATKLAAPKYRRAELEDVKLNLHEEQLSGKNIYKRLLDTPKKYKETQRLLKPYPKALKSLKNMREGWREYANIKTGSQAEAQAKTRIDQARNILDWVNDFLQSNIGKRATEAQLRYIHSPEWKNGFALIENAKNQRDALNKTLDLIGKMGLAYGLSNNEIDNLKKMITQSE